MTIQQHIKNPSMIVAVTALVVATSGTSYAVSALPKNSVGAAQIKTAAVRSSEVKDGSLLAKDFAKSVQLKGDKGDTGPQGPQGLKGDTGAFGAATVRSLTAPVDLADGTKQTYNVFCPAGQQAIGGGGRGDVSQSEEIEMTSLRPAVSETNTEPPAEGGTFTGWRLTAYNPAGGVAAGLRPTVWVVCVPAPTT